MKSSGCTKTVKDRLYNRFMRLVRSAAIADFAHVPMPSFSVLNSTRQTMIATHVDLADTPTARRVGLLKHERLELGQGLYFPARSWLPFMAIHTIRMKFPIDVFFLDENDRVVALYTLPPNRVAWVIGTRRVLETAEGTIAVSGTRIGDNIELRLLQISNNSVPRKE